MTHRLKTRLKVCVQSAAFWSVISCNNGGVSSSYCKASEAESTVSPRPSDADAGMGDAGNAGDAGLSIENNYEGLYCVEYYPTGKASLHVNLINYWADCSGPFEVQMTDSASSRIEVTVQPHECAASGCMCPYDFSLEVPDLQLKSDIALKIGRFSCISYKAESFESATLRSNEAPSGIICQYFGTRLGGRHAPCGENAPCDEGLICADTETLTDVQPVCLVPCQSAFDCPVPETFTCDEGACHVIANMTQRV